MGSASLDPTLTLICIECRSVADAIYSGVSGAQLTNISGLGEIYTLPCDQEINLTFVFSGTKYPVHPLDTNLNGTDLQITDGSNDALCIGAVSHNQCALHHY